MKKLMVVVFSVAIMVFAVSCGNNSSSPAAPEPAATPTPDGSGFYSTTSSGVTLKWKITGSSIDFKLSATAAGWVGVGFNTSGNMSGSDYIMGYVTGGSTATISDGHGTGHSVTQDSSQDLTAMSGTESGGVTEIHFTRLLDTGDSDDMVLSQGMSVWVILAYHSSADNLTSEHTNYGAKEITLY